MIYILWTGWDYVSASWAIQETSAEAGGLAYLYILKSLILIMAGLVVLQSLAVAAQAWLDIQSPQSPTTNDIKETEGTL